MISVVIPAFNEESFLSPCLESLKNQDYKGNYEIIIVDNASTDGTARVAVELGARLVSCTRKGVAYAREAGARAAAGDIIAQADADTTYPPDWLSRIEKHFVSNPRSVALAGGYVYEKRHEPSWSKVDYFGKYLLNAIAGRVFWGRPIYISGANFSFRREAFLKVNGYDPNSLYPDQWGISRRLSRAGRIVFDGNLLVTTSARRIQRPFRVIFLEVLVNFGGVLRHAFKHIRHQIGRFVTGFTPEKASFRLAASALLAVVNFIFPFFAVPDKRWFALRKMQIKRTYTKAFLSFKAKPQRRATRKSSLSWISSVYKQISSLSAKLW